VIARTTSIHLTETTGQLKANLAIASMLPVNLARKMLALSLIMVGVAASAVSVGSEWNQHDALKERVPIFSEYQIKNQYRALSANPRITGHWRKFRTRIREGAANPPNFAGAFRIVKWGCGSDCIMFALIDLRDGSIYDPPFDSLWLDAYAVYGWYGKGLVFRPDSSLLIVDGCPTEKCATYYYEWTGTSFKLVYTKTKHPKD